MLPTGRFAPAGCDRRRGSGSAARPAASRTWSNSRYRNGPSCSTDAPPCESSRQGRSGRGRSPRTHGRSPRDTTPASCEPLGRGGLSARPAVEGWVWLGAAWQARRASASLPRTLRRAGPSLPLGRRDHSGRPRHGLPSCSRPEPRSGWSTTRTDPGSLETRGMPGPLRPCGQRVGQSPVPRSGPRQIRKDTRRKLSVPKTPGLPAAGIRCESSSGARQHPDRAARSRAES